MSPDGAAAATAYAEPIKHFRAEHFRADGTGRLTRPRSRPPL